MLRRDVVAGGVGALLVLAACTGGDGGPETTRATASAAGSAPATAPVTTTEAPAIPIHADDGIGDPYYPNLGNAGYDVEHVELAIRFDPALPRIDGVATLRATALANLDSWSVDLATMFASAVHVDGEPARFEHGGGELRIDPAAVVAAGAVFEMRIEYGGVPAPFDSAGAPFPTGFQASRDGYFGMSEPDGASSWFPANDHPLDKATYAIEVTVPLPLVVASTGTLVDVSNEAGWAAYRWESADPVAPYLVALGIGDLERTEEVGPGGVPIRNYFDDDLPDSTRALFDRQSEMLAYLVEVFGPYPFEAYGALVLDTDTVGAALETQTLSTFGLQSLGLGEDVVVHELAHQWYGNSVSVGRWQDIWLNEGFATYSQWLWIEHTEGVEARNVRIAQAYDVISGRVFLNDDIDERLAAQIARREFPPPGSPEPEDLFNASVYLRGGLTLHALRETVGDAAFFDILAAHAGEHAHGNARTEDFIAIAERIHGAGLGELFDEWLYAPTMPALAGLDLEPVE